MPKVAKALSPGEVDQLRAIGFHAIGEVSGLGLQIVPSGARSWVLRTMIGGRRRKMGLGGYPDVTMEAAKDKARAAKLKIDAGVDPIADRKTRKQNLRKHPR